MDFWNPREAHRFVVQGAVSVVIRRVRIVSWGTDVFVGWGALFACVALWAASTFPGVRRFSSSRAESVVAIVFFCAIETGFVSK